MFRFIVRRLLFGVLVLWLISVLVFVLFFVAPHDPARLIAGRLATPDTIALVRNRLGLDQPVLRQYAHFLAELAHGNLGYSYYNSESVDSLIAGRLPVTASLTLGAAVIWLLLGVGTGVLAARRPRSGVDRGATLFVLLGLSMPTFLVGLLLLYFLFFRLHLAGIDAFPGGGYVPLTQNPARRSASLHAPCRSLSPAIRPRWASVGVQFFHSVWEPGRDRPRQRPPRRRENRNSAYWLAGIGVRRRD